jgi:hypothetical protein
MSCSHLVPIPEVQNCQHSHQFGAIVLIQVPKQVLAFNPSTGIISSPQDFCAQAQPHFEQDVQPQPNTPTMWSWPPPRPDQCRATLQSWQLSFSLTGSHYPGPTFPLVMDFNEYGEHSGGVSIHSPTPALLLIISTVANRTY